MYNISCFTPDPEAGKISHFLVRGTNKIFPSISVEDYYIYVQKNKKH